MKKTETTNELIRRCYFYDTIYDTPWNIDYLCSLFIFKFNANSPRSSDTNQYCKDRQPLPLRKSFLISSKSTNNIMRNHDNDHYVNNNNNNNNNVLFNFKINFHSEHRGNCKNVRLNLCTNKELHGISMLLNAMEKERERMIIMLTITNKFDKFVILRESLQTDLTMTVHQWIHYKIKLNETLQSIKTINTHLDIERNILLCLVSRYHRNMRKDEIKSWNLLYKLIYNNLNQCDISYKTRKELMNKIIIHSIQ